MDKINKQPVFTIMVGSPRSGKDTWIEKNKKNAIVVSNDWIRENILGTHYSDKANAIIWSISDSTIRILLGQGKDVILNGVNLTKGTRKFWVDLGSEYGAIIKMVYMKTSLDTCIKRNKDTKKLPNEKLVQMYHSFEAPYTHEYHKLIIVEEK